jgi:alkylation response protein AidB-like acyl-CoA dehydrogenase
MNFAFSDDSRLLRDQARRFLAERCPASLVRAALDAAPPQAAALWREMAGLGWLGVGLPEAHGGAGLGAEALCVLAEELGRALAPVPFLSGRCLAAEAIAQCGSPAQQAAWLPRLAAGEATAAFALAEGAGDPSPGAIRARLRNGRIDGTKLPVADGMNANIAVIAAQDADGPVLALVDLAGPGVERQPVAMIDPSLPHANVTCRAAPAERLPGAAGWNAIAALLDRAAVPAAFAALGGASAALEMAVAYAKERHAFGRAIGSFQAIKHKLADVYVAVELARSNAWYACWALERDAGALPLAAATAKVSADAAFFQAAKENIQTHGGIGFTWDADPHLFYRRAMLLAHALGGPRFWKERMMAALETANAA